MATLIYDNALDRFQLRSQIFMQNDYSKLTLSSPQEVTQSAGTTPHEAEITSSNPPSPLLCGHVKKKKKKTHFIYFN
jgi:hypothetical protein